MDRDSIRAFIARDWALVADLKRDHHVARFRKTGGSWGLQAGNVMRRYARKVRPDLPTTRDRAEDLAHHIALKRFIDRAAHAFPAR